MAGHNHLVGRLIDEHGSGEVPGPGCQLGYLDPLPSPLLAGVEVHRRSFPHTFFGDDQEVAEEFFPFVAGAGRFLREGFDVDDEVVFYEPDASHPHRVPAGRSDIGFRKPDGFTFFRDQHDVVFALGYLDPDQFVFFLKCDGD